MSVFTNSASGAADQAAAYTAALLDLLGTRDPLAVLRDMPAALTRAIAGLSPEQLRQPERQGKWSIAQVLQHLADAELAVAWRYRLILSQDRPPLTGYDQDLWAKHLHYEQANPADALEQFGALRRANVRILERASAADLTRVGLHSERGEESIEHIRKLTAGHDLLHLRQIDRIKSAVA